jgi:chromosomal replication initiator protein
METTVIWQDFLTIVRHEVGSRVVETWFKAVKLVSWDAHKKIAYLQAPNNFIKDWLTTHYTMLFHQHLGRLLNEREVTVLFVESVSDATVSLNQSTVAELSPSTESSTRKSFSLPAVNASPSRVATVNQHYVFESFVVGPANHVAFGAARAIAQRPGKLYNPLFIHSASGLGKTHLLHAIGNQIRAYNKQALIVYQTADRFVNEFIHALRFDKMRQFEAKYKHLDVLLIDDIQIISHKEQTQEAFFYIFNALQQAHKQIVCSSDLSPRAITGLPDRMRSRLEGGLVVDMHMVDLETKVAIVQKKALLHNVNLSSEIAQCVAETVDSNIRELEGALIRVVAFASLTKQPISLDLVYQVLLKESHNKKPLVPPDLHQIATKVAHHFDYTIHDLRSAKRHKELAIARHVTMYLMKKLTGRSLREIGHFLDRKDHSTVIHACEKIEQIRTKDASFSHLIQKLEHAWC